MELKLSEYQKELYSENVVFERYTKLGRKTTICLIETHNGFEIIGTSACVNPDFYSKEIGEFFALVDALDKLDGFVGFLRQEREFEKGQMKGVE
jgi:hypothetical protein